MKEFASLSERSRLAVLNGYLRRLAALTSEPDRIDTEHLMTAPARSLEALAAHEGKTLQDMWNELCAAEGVKPVTIPGVVLVGEPEDASIRVQ